MKWEKIDFGEVYTNSIILKLKHLLKLLVFLIG